MSDQIVEFRIVDADDDLAFSSAACPTREEADRLAAALTRDEPTYAPYRVQTRVVTDWTDLATEAAAVSPAAA